MTETTQTDPQAQASAGSKPASKPVKWIGSFALGGAVLVVAVALVALVLARYGLIAKISGFIAFMSMMIPAGVIAAAAAVALAIAFFRKTGPRWQAAGGLALSLALLGAMYVAVLLPAGKAPPMHDITTDVDDPPQFATLSLREDNLVPFASMEEWRASHRQNYADIGPVIIGKAPAAVLADARALAESKGWDIAAYDAAAGHMEATAYAGFIRFMDDVIVEVTPIEDGSTRVDMRSVSRVGVSDLGYNAARIREFLAELQQA